MPAAPVSPSDARSRTTSWDRATWRTWVTRTTLGEAAGFLFPVLVVLSGAGDLPHGTAVAGAASGRGPRGGDPRLGPEFGAGTPGRRILEAGLDPAYRTRRHRRLGDRHGAEHMGCRPGRSAH